VTYREAYANWRELSERAARLHADARERARELDRLRFEVAEIDAAELDPAAEIVVMCRSGGRSAQVARFLQQQGFSNVWNLAGGILAWSEQLDPSTPSRTVALVPSGQAKV
jgi:rhodanese-related sulfurtransferase